MREQFLIGANEDVRNVLEAANKLNLTIRLDEPAEQPKPTIIPPERFFEHTSGVFMLSRKDWVFGEPKYNFLDGGYHKGKYSQQPAVNAVNILFHYTKERIEDGIHRLGSGSISRDTDWYCPEDHAVYAAPDEVKVVFKAFTKALAFKKTIKGGGHRYAVLPHAWEKLQSGAAMPPFDYIPWPQ